eukprot:TRINITY_DN43177_c0_g2_i1.p1 TRINITY_DN43177_c0_g2~~TRINITY_DN43177_c0_g2_i1.p1  ORF type:complete len:271 (-),score=41.65 TRINITY_DN43177_c0_g2_i1:505-1278(-)
MAGDILKCDEPDLLLTTPDVTSTRRRYEEAQAKFAPGDVRRYGWKGYTATDFYNAYDELALMIPRGVRRVLDVGCGGGEFAEVLLRRRPEVEFVGLDLSMDNIRASEARLKTYSHRCQFVCCDFWEFFLGCSEGDSSNDTLGEVVTWDFVVSIGCVFSHCYLTKTTLEQQLDLLDAMERSASHGFVLLCHGSERGQGICLRAARDRVLTYSQVPTAADLQSETSSDSVVVFVSDEGNRERKPCLQKLRFHRLVMLLR